MVKKLFRAAYGDDSRIMFILADNLQEAIKMANERELDGDDDSDDYFHFDSETVFEVNLCLAPALPQIPISRSLS